MGSIYNKKRKKAGLSVYSIAQYLRLPYKKALEIDKGKRDLAGEYMDRFNEACENATEINLENKNKMFEVKRYFLSDSPKEDLRKLGYSQRELKGIFDCSAQPINFTFNKRVDRVSNEMLERIYDFLHDYANKKIEEEPKKEAIQSTLFSEEIVPAMNEIISPEDNEIVLIEEPREEEEVDEIKEEPISTKIEEIEPSDIAEPMDEFRDKNIEDLIKIIKSKNEEISKLNKQISRYEKLIDMI